MEQTITLVQFQSRGVLNIPKAIREMFQIAKGTMAKIFVKDDAIIVKPVEAVVKQQFEPRIFSKTEIRRFLKEDKLDRVTLARLDEKLKKKGGFRDPIIKKWLKR